MFKKLGVGILTVNAINACGCLKGKIIESVIEDEKKKIKEEDEKEMKFIKSLLSDENAVVSHSNTLNSDDFLKKNTVFLENATEDDKKQVVEIVKKNLKKIKESAKYGENSFFCLFEIKVSDKITLNGIIEFDKSKVKPDEESKLKKYKTVIPVGLLEELQF